MGRFVSFSTWARYLTNGGLLNGCCYVAPHAMHWGTDVDLEESFNIVATYAVICWFYIYIYPFWTGHQPNSTGLLLFLILLEGAHLQVTSQPLIALLVQTRDVVFASSRFRIWFQAPDLHQVQPLPNWIALSIKAAYLESLDSSGSLNLCAGGISWRRIHRQLFTIHRAGRVLVVENHHF